MDDRCDNLPGADSSPPTFCISHDGVRQALDSLIYTAADGPVSPLVHLQLVSDLLDTPSMPRSSHGRQFALHSLLSQAISTAQARCQQALHLPHEVEIGCQQQALSAIARDAKTGHVELMGWNWLYYRYLRPELHITPERFGAAAGIDVRTLRRYQRHAILRLTLRLIEWEQQARDQRHQKRLYARLPLPAAVRLFGRDEALGYVQGLLAATPTPHIQVNGAAGSGKTTLVQEAVRRQIDAGEVDYLIWLEHPPAMTAVRECLNETLPLQTAPASLRDCAARYQLVIVLDGIGGLLEQRAELESLLNDLSTEVVYLTERAYCPLPDVLGCLTLSELNRETALAFAGWLIAQDSVLKTWYDPNALVENLWQRAGGNPQRIKQALCELRQEALKFCA